MAKYTRAQNVDDHIDAIREFESNMPKNRKTWEPQEPYVVWSFQKHRSAKRHRAGSSGKQRNNTYGLTGEAPRVGSRIFLAPVTMRVIAKSTSQWSGMWRNGQTDTFTHILAVPEDYKPKAADSTPPVNDNKLTPVKITESRQRVVTTRPYPMSQLRKRMLAKNPVCPVTGIDRPQFLRVSHIRADSACEFDWQKADDANILMLSLAANELFDGLCPQGFNGWKGRAAWITFADDGKLMRSLHMTGDELRRFGISHHVSIAHLLKGNTGERRRGYLKWHRENMFLDNIRKEETDG
tara:strand:- start:603 stop:1487 length:885 start_codon:yes stop_codon:yes gene_type:complete